MTQHTQGRLHTGAEIAGTSLDRVIYAESRWSVAESKWHGDSIITKQEAKANALRLVACWNACEGFETETLELMASGNAPSLREIFREHGELWAQRDELLAALKALLAADPWRSPLKPLTMPTLSDKWDGIEQAVRMAEAAIAKAQPPEGHSHG